MAASRGPVVKYVKHHRITRLEGSIYDLEIGTIIQASHDANRPKGAVVINRP
jgi:hypothetical protein